MGVLKAPTISGEVVMLNTDRTTGTQDEYEIANLLFRWGYARDSYDWETLSACFHEDATIHLSWVSGLARDFIARSRVMATARKPGTQMKHVISWPWVQIKRDRAFSRCHVNFYSRTILEGHEFDLQSWMRFFDLLERREGIWRIVKRTAVYEKDRMDPVDPPGIPQDFFADMDLSAFPPSAKFLCYDIVRRGLSPSLDIISVYSDEERALREESEAWIETP
jgi:3-phenylpropionate/cinnamic acid dioxygenase small subunit